MDRLINLLLDAANLGLEMPAYRARRLAAVAFLAIVLTAPALYFEWVQELHQPKFDAIIESVTESIMPTHPATP